MNWLKRIFGRAEPPISSPRSDAATVASLREKYRQQARPAVHFHPRDETSFTQFGGSPLLPEEFGWPEWRNQPLSFLAQLDLSEIHAVLPSCLPSSGLLYFFFDQDQEASGFDAADAGGWRVLFYRGDRATLKERAAPAGLDPEFVFACQPVVAHRTEVLPDLQRLSKSASLSERERDAYVELREAVFTHGTHHQMLGFPSPVQSDEMEAQCQLVSHGLPVSIRGQPDDPRRRELAAGASEWTLLLQLDSDDDIGWMWGDVGTLYFWIRETDARAGNFNHVWLVSQCC